MLNVSAGEAEIYIICGYAALRRGIDGLTLADRLPKEKSPGTIDWSLIQSQGLFDELGEQPVNGRCQGCSGCGGGWRQKC